VAVSKDGPRYRFVIPGTRASECERTQAGCHPREIKRSGDEPRQSIRVSRGSSNAWRRRASDRGRAH
jgi:hypothetical protein